MSTVTPLAFCRSAPSSHSTWNFTRETMRRWVRSFSHRSSKTFPAGMLMVVTAVSMAIPNLAACGFRNWPGNSKKPGAAKDKIFPGKVAVNSTYSKSFFPLGAFKQPFHRRAVLGNLLSAQTLVRNSILRADGFHFFFDIGLRPSHTGPRPRKCLLVRKFVHFGKTRKRGS